MLNLTLNLSLYSNHNAIWYIKISFLLLNSKYVINILINLLLNVILKFVIKLIWNYKIEIL